MAKHSAILGSNPYCSPPCLVAVQDGGFAVIWSTGDGRDIQGSEVTCRFFDDAGRPKDRLFPISSGTEYVFSVNHCAIECADKILDVFWQGRYPNESNVKIFAARLDPVDGYTTPAIALNSSTDVIPYSPQAAPVRDGIVVVWEAVQTPLPNNRSPRGRTLTDKLIPASAEFRPFSIEGKDKTGLGLGTAAGGDTAVFAWTSEDPGPNTGYEFAQRLDIHGHFVGDLIEVRRGRTLGNQIDKAVVSRKTGGFHIFYCEWNPDSVYGIPTILFGCSFDEQGLQIGETVEVEHVAKVWALDPAAVVLPTGMVAVFWMAERLEPFSQKIWMRLISNDGVPIGQKVQISPEDGLAHRNPSAAVLQNGLIAVAWIAYDEPRNRMDIATTLVSI